METVVKFSYLISVPGVKNSRKLLENFNDYPGPVEYISTKVSNS